MAKSNSVKKPAATKKPPTKSELYGAISITTSLSKKQVASVIDALDGATKKSLKTHGGFTLPGICKMVVRKKPATKAREGVNPFTGEKIMIKAKPASKTVRIRPLKALKAAL